jgi:hypothetical protein
MFGCVLPPMQGRLSVHLTARPQFSVDCPVKYVLVRGYLACLTYSGVLVKRVFANAGFQVFVFPPFIVSSANRDFSFYVSAYFNFSTRKKCVPSALTSFYTHTTLIAITHCPAETPFPRKVSRSVRLPRFVYLSVNVKSVECFSGS